MKNKIKILILVLTIAAISKSYAQVAYYDALKIKSYLSNGQIPDDTTKLNSIYSILKHYVVFAENDKKDNLTTVMSAFAGNSFLNQMGIGIGGVQADNKTMIASAVSFVGNANVTSFANGFSNYLIKHGTEELLIAIINSLKDDKKYPEFKILFPHTRLLLDNFDPSEYSNVLNTIKEAFDKDLQQLLGDIPQLTTLDRSGFIDPVTKKHVDYDKDAKARVNAIKDFIDTDAGRLLISAMEVSNGFITGQKIPDIIHSVSGNGFLGDIPKADPNVTNAIRLLDIVSYSIRSNIAGKDYISLADFTTLMTDPVSSKIYLGLLYQQLKNEKITINGNALAGMLSSDATGFIKFAKQLISKIDPLKTSISAFVNARKKGEKDLTTYLDAVIQNADQFFTSATDISVINSTFMFPDKLEIVIQYVSNTLEIVNDICAKNYSAAVTSSLTFMSDNIKSQNSSGFVKFFVKYGSFAANLIQAQKPADAEAAIESVALPAGSYTIKQNSDFNISLNGYIGYALDFKHFDVSQGLYANGISAPVGFSFTHSFGGFFTPSIFFSVIDLGSVVAYNLSNPNTSTTSSSGTNTSSTTSSMNQQIKLGSLFSPSAQVFFGIRKTPIVVGAGWRRTPTLFYSSGSTYTTVGAKSVFNISALIDIPIFTLHNTPLKN